MIRAIWQYANKIGSSAGMLFVDLSSAFASLVRELTYTQDRSPAAIACIAERFAMPSSLYTDFASLVNGLDAMQLAEVGFHLRASLCRPMSAPGSRCRELTVPLRPTQDPRLEIPWGMFCSLSSSLGFFMTWLDGWRPLALLRAYHFTLSAPASSLPRPLRAP
eukprot:4723066-Lingulodinium_polyedra.AAC.1